MLSSLLVLWDDLQLFGLKESKTSNISSPYMQILYIARLNPCKPQAVDFASSYFKWQLSSLNICDL